MFRNYVQPERAVSAIVFCGLVALTVIGVFEIAAKQVVGLPILLLALFGWGGMFSFHVILPLIAAIRVLARLNRKLFAQV